MQPLPRTPKKNASTQTLLRAVAWSAFFSVLSAIVAYIAKLDLCILHNEMGETSLTELAQLALLVFTTTCFLSTVPRHPENRGFTILATGLFACMTFREMDGFFDPISTSFWTIPVALVLLACATLVSPAPVRTTILPGAAAFLRARSSDLMLFGLLIVLVFSRLYTSGHLIWNKLLGPGQHCVQTYFQEGLELFGYLFIATSAFLHCTRPGPKPPARSPYVKE